MLVAIEVITALETSRAGKLGVFDHVVIGNTLIGEGISPIDARPVEPPFVAAEQQVRVGNAADARRRRAMPVVDNDRQALGGDQFAPPARRGVGRVIMQQIRVVHRVHPAADIVVGERLA